MSNCILCSKTGKDRKYFLPGKLLCDEHYSGYLEIVVDDFEEEFSDESRNSAYEKYKIKLELKPVSIISVLKSEPTPDSDTSLIVKI